MRLQRIRTVRARRYHYGADPGEAAPAWPHHLTGISLTEKPTGDTASAAPNTRRLSTYAYDSKGRAVMSVRGAARQLDEAGKVVPGTGIGQVELDFSTPGSTLLTNSLGQHTRYRYTRLGGETRLLEAIGPGCASCSETNVRYGYDKRGRLIEVTRLDATGRALAATVIERDAMGRVVRESILPHAGRNPMPARLLVRYEYADDGARPVLVARPSVVRGREHQLRYSFNAAGQITRVTEHGFSSLGGSGVPAADPSEATPIERTTTFTYTMINGRSLLAAIDGPLANGPGASPADSDIAIFHWDPQGSQMIALAKPGGSRHTLDYHPLTGLLQRVSNDEGQATAFSYTLVSRWSRHVATWPGWAQPWAQHFRYDDLGRAVASSNATQPVENWLRVWDEHGRLMWHASALGLLDHYAYDAEGRLVERQPPQRILRPDRVSPLRRAGAAASPSATTPAAAANGITMRSGACDTPSMLTASSIRQLARPAPASLAPSHQRPRRPFATTSAARSGSAVRTAEPSCASTTKPTGWPPCATRAATAPATRTTLGAASSAKGSRTPAPAPPKRQCGGMPGVVWSRSAIPPSTNATNTTPAACAARASSPCPPPTER